MRAVSTTLTFWILVLPSSLLVSAFFLVIYSYRMSLDASVILESMSTLLSAVLVDLLVWERLRNSLSKKLKYLHKNYLFKLYSTFRDEEVIYFGLEDEIKRIRNDLGSYGRFIRISLCPRGLLNRIDEFLFLHGEFYGRLQKIKALAEQLIGKSPLDTSLFWHFVGLKKQERLNEYDSQLVQIYEGKIQLIMKERAQLVDEMRGFLEKTVKLRRQIFSKLEDFLKSNNLRLEPESPLLYP